MYFAGCVSECCLTC